jgi:hypothetical protein
MRSSIIILSLAFCAIATPVTIKKDPPASNCNKAAKCCFYSAGILLAKGNKVVARKGMISSATAPKAMQIIDRGGIRESDPIPFSKEAPVAFNRCPWVKAPSDEEYKKVMAMDVGELKDYAKNRESIKAVMDSFYQNGS